MSFRTDINTLMNADSAINALVSSINFLQAQDNKSLTADYIVYNNELIDEISSFDAYNEYDIYKHEIIIFSASTTTLDTITAAVRAYLDNYETTPFLDVRLISDEPANEGEKEQYSNILEYRIIYLN